MRVITHCPACQTQFFATEEQLNQHGGKVRCGQCLQVFDARAQLLVATDGSEHHEPSVLADLSQATVEETPAAQSPPAENETLSETVQAASAEVAIETVQPSPSLISDSLTLHKKRMYTSHTIGRWLWPAGAVILVVSAVLQGIYFMRDRIAVHYPQLKPYLLLACAQLACSINLPRNIEFIIIDDSDMHEDTEHTGVVRFSSTLINNGPHVVAFPNLELTLTDTQDKPVLRRIFKPAEYVPAQNNIDEGIQAGAEIRLNLAMTTQDVAVAGYRVFVTY